MPALSIVSRDTSATLSLSGVESTVLVLFHSACEFCKREFDGLEQASELLASTRFVLVTPEDTFDQADLEARWPRLFGARGTIVGSVQANAFMETFGVLTTPANFVFDSTGLLLAWVPGMVSPEWISEVLNGEEGTQEHSSHPWLSCGTGNDSIAACSAPPPTRTTGAGPKP